MDTFLLILIIILFVYTIIFFWIGIKYININKKLKELIFTINNLSKNLNEYKKWGRNILNEERNVRKDKFKFVLESFYSLEIKYNELLSKLSKFLMEMDKIKFK